MIAMTRLFILLAITFSCLASGALVAADVVVLKGQSGKPPSRKSGTIVDWTGDHLTLRSPSGQLTKIPTPRIERVESQWNEPHRQADELFGQGKFEQAASHYRQAVADESRRWVLRMQIARRIQCIHALNRQEEACVEFLKLVQSDPNTHYFSVIPLVWKSAQPPANLVQRAQTWLEGQDAVASLLGASLLISTSHRFAAAERLQQLTRDTDPRIARLAMAQLWRTQTATAKPADLSDWTEQVGSLEGALQAGPYYVLASAQRQSQMPDRALINFLRIPILYPEQYQLAGQALLDSAEILHSQGRTRQATRLLNELLQRFPACTAAQQAKTIQESLK